MIKKILVGAFGLVVIAAVVLGVIELANRSEMAYAQHGRNAVADVSDDLLPRGNGGAGAERFVPRGNGGAGAQSTSSGGNGGAGRGRDRGTGYEPELGQGTGPGAQGQFQGGGAQGRGQGTGTGQGTGGQGQLNLSEDVDIVQETIEGTVVQVTELVIETVDGQQVQIGLGPSAYREGQGFVLEVGEQVRVSGHWEDGEFKAGQVVKVASGESIVLRDESGRPLWAGQGRRGG